MPNTNPNTHPLTVEISGDQGNVFAILSTVSRYMRDTGMPGELIEHMFNEAMSASSYQAALMKITVITGCQYTHHGHPVHQLGKD